MRLLEARRDRKEEEEAGGAKLKLIKDLQYKRREERGKKKPLDTQSVKEDVIKS